MTYHISTTDLQHLLKSNKWQFPTHKEDLLGAMAAMFRLQDTYNISAVDMADNNIIGERRRGLSQINELILGINVSILATAHLPRPPNTTSTVICYQLTVLGQGYTVIQLLTSIYFCVFSKRPGELILSALTPSNFSRISFFCVLEQDTKLSPHTCK